ncbi:hypothetical protein HEK616_40460 [Streptomyces nigrescens]|uniref:Uncharacterized protein n=1 Tax=Streptomyces nigrescens TaxID=1920 RepID=A0ABM7ZW10_STRNI|nr:hypothetical protein [Streptomyces nigrescens]BDM70559.1 hypothetical protein HEK616_40460 [Streptomyces nigrescens]
MTRLPSLDDYDVQGVRPDEAALYGEETVLRVEALESATAADWYADH